MDRGKENALKQDLHMGLYKKGKEHEANAGTNMETVEVKFFLQIKNHPHQSHVCL